MLHAFPPVATLLFGEIDQTYKESINRYILASYIVKLEISFYSVHKNSKNFIYGFLEFLLIHSG